MSLPPYKLSDVDRLDVTLGHLNTMLTQIYAGTVLGAGPTGATGSTGPTGPTGPTG